MDYKDPKYDFSQDIFKKNPLYKRLAKAHLSLKDLKSEVIEWEVNNTRGNIKIPSEYLVHYNLKSIIGINEDESPIYGYRHTIRITFPPRYPMENPELYAQSKVWHPNIKWEGKYSGRICGNTKEFGLSYDLYLLIIRIGEILQYKRYHAEHTPPYPEDLNVANWVLKYAEPKGIVDKQKNIFVDGSSLVEKESKKEPIIKNELDVEDTIKPNLVEVEKTSKKEKIEPIQEPNVKTEKLPTTKKKKGISIGSVRKAPKKNIKIKKKN